MSLSSSLEDGLALASLFSWWRYESIRKSASNDGSSKGTLHAKRSLKKCKVFWDSFETHRGIFLKCRLNVKQVKNFLFFMSRPNSLKAMKIVKIISLFLLLFRILFILWLKKELWNPRDSLQLLPVKTLIILRECHVNFGKEFGLE